MKSVALHNLGCKVNSYEFDGMQQMLRESGYKIVPFDQEADVYIINTCTVTNIADRKSRQMIHRAKKRNPQAVVVAAGCYVQTAGEALGQEEAIDIAIGNNRKKDIVSILEDYWKSRMPSADDAGAPVEDSGKTECVKAGRTDGLKDSGDRAVLEIIDIAAAREYEEMQLTRTAEHTRACIKIQDGCNQFCSYCIIPYARGRVRSRREEDIVREVQGIVRAGYREIVLTGIHISSYGVDRGKTELLQLLCKLHEIEGLERIRLGSLEPRIVTEEFVAAISAMPKICPHFHLSLQSGCDSVLDRMNRHYTAGEYFQTTELLRNYYRDPAITTDVIVGFPGETEEEFRITEEFVRKVNFYEMHIFKYSKRQGTKAAAMESQITESEKSRRSAILAQAEKEMSHAFRAGYRNREVTVLFEEKKEIDGTMYWVGHTPQYIRAAKAAEGAGDLSNHLTEGKMTAFLRDDIMLLK